MQPMTNPHLIHILKGTNPFEDTHLGHEILGSRFEQMLQLLCIHIGIGQLIPNGLTHHLRYHVLTHFLPEELDLIERNWISLYVI